MSYHDEITDEEMDARRGASQPWCSKCEKYEEDCTCEDDDELERAHMRKMVEHAQDVAECEHKYREEVEAPLGVRCLHCGHFVGAWE